MDLAFATELLTSWESRNDVSGHWDTFSDDTAQQAVSDVEIRDQDHWGGMGGVRTDGLERLTEVEAMPFLGVEELGMPVEEQAVVAAPPPHLVEEPDIYVEEVSTIALPPIGVEQPVATEHLYGVEGLEMPVEEQAVVAAPPNGVEGLEVASLDEEPVVGAPTYGVEELDTCMSKEDFEILEVLINDGNSQEALPPKWSSLRISRSEAAQEGVSHSEIRDQDHLGGRGGKVNNHPCNQKVLKWVEELKKLYQAYTMKKSGEKAYVLSKQQKTDMSRSIVDKVFENGGRFLSKPDENGLRYPITKMEALRRISQKFREGKRSHPMTDKIDKYNV